MNSNRAGHARWPAAGLLSIALTIIAAGANPARAVDVIFTINSNLSTQSWSGSDDVYGAFSPQFPGSLSTPVDGSFVVSFDPSTDTPQSIQLIGNSGQQQRLLRAREQQPELPAFRHAGECRWVGPQHKRRFSTSRFATWSITSTARRFLPTARRG